MKKNKYKVGPVLPADDLMAVLQLMTLWPPDLLEFKIQALMDAEVFIGHRVKEGEPYTGLRVNYPKIEEMRIKAKKELEELEARKDKKKPKGKTR